MTFELPAQVGERGWGRELGGREMNECEREGKREELNAMEGKKRECMIPLSRRDRSEFVVPWQIKRPKKRF